MSVRWTAFVLFVGAAGCRQASSSIDDRANDKLYDEHTYATRNLRYATCPDRGVIAGNCGLVLRHASTEDFRAKFRASKCVGKDDAACEALYQRMIDAWLIQRYPLADWREVGLTCDADPGKCDDPIAYEGLLIDSHNRRIQDDYARAENQIEADRAQALAYLAYRGPKCRSYPSALTGETTTICAP